MASLLGLAHVGGSFVQVTQTALGGSGTTNLYGKLDREAHDTSVIGGWERMGAFVTQLGDDIYLLVGKAGQTARVYKGYDGAILLRADGVDPTPTLPLAGETITQGGVTGTLVEDYRANDDFFVVINETGGTFGAGGVTFTTGSPAVITTREANGGQFALEFESDVIAHATANIWKTSGLHHGLSGGIPTLAFAYADSTGTDIHTCIRNASSGLFEDSETIAGAGTDFARNSGSVVHRNTIYWLYTGNTNANTVYAVTLNIGTGVVTLGSLAYGGNFAYVSHPIIWNGRIFFSLSQGTTSTRIYEISGGSIILILDIPNVGATWDTSSPGSGFVGVDDNALYWVIRNSSSQNQVIRLYDDGTDIVLSCPLGGELSLDDDVGEALLPAAIRTSIVSGSHGHSFLDIETTVGSKLQRFWFYNGQVVGGTEYKYIDAVALDSGTAATVSGTIGNFDDLVFGSSVAASLSVGDWIILADSNSCYRVDAVATVNVQLGNLTTAGDPTGTAIQQPTPTAGSEVINKVQVMGTESGTEGGLAGVALPHGTVGGGHVYTVGEVSGEFNAQEAVVGGVKLTFTIFDPFSNLTASTGKARGYYLKEDGTFGQMTLLSVGQGTKNGNINETLSSGSGQTFVWDSGADSVANGVFTDKFIEIFI